MQIIDRETIRSALEKDSVIACAREAFIAHAKGEITSPMPMHLEFVSNKNEYIGDCHVKAANSPAYPYFAVKLASGFYKNPEQGLPVNNGLVLLLSSTTGQPIALLQDEGLLTSYRTAAAGAVAASLYNSEKNDVLGIYGTGHQAEQQALWISHHLQLKTVLIRGRSMDKAEVLANRLNTQGLTARVVNSTQALCAKSNILVTTTPVREPIIQSSDIDSSLHIIAMGSDIPGKQEIESKVLQRASCIANDDIAQCLDHGETGAAVRAGLISESSSQYLGSLLENNFKSERTEISLVDLTGLGAQDLAIANLLAERLNIG